MPAKTDHVPDPRHSPIRNHIATTYAAYNDGLTVPWSGHTATVLARLLKQLPAWPAEQFIKCVNNRFASEVNTAADPLDWLNSARERLVNYVSGPLDRWGKLIRVRWSDNDKAAAAYRERAEQKAAEFLKTATPEELEWAYNSSRRVH